MSGLLISLKEGLKAFTERRNYKSVLIFWTGTFILLTSVLSLVATNHFRMGLILPDTAVQNLSTFSGPVLYPTGFIGIIILIWNLVYTVKKNMAEELETSPLIDSIKPAANIMVAELFLGMVFFILYLLTSISILITIPLTVYLLAAVAYHPFIIIEDRKNFVRAIRESFRITAGARRKTEILVLYLLFVLLQTGLIWVSVSLLETLFGYLSIAVLAVPTSIILSFTIFSFTGLYQRHRDTRYHRIQWIL